MKSRAKNLGLMGVFLGGAVVLSGCVNSADQLLQQGQITREQHAVMKAQEQEQNRRGLLFGLLGAGLSSAGAHKGYAPAVQTGNALTALGVAQAGASRNTTYVNVNNGLGEEENSSNNSTPYCRPFIGERWEDVNRDGCFDIKTELVGRGKTIFRVGESIIFGVEQNGYRGSNLRMIIKQDGEHRPFEEVTISKDGSLPHTGFIYRKPSQFELYMTLDGQKIGSFDIVVK